MGKLRRIRGEGPDVDVHMVGPELRGGIHIVLQNAEGGGSVIGIAVAEFQVGVWCVKRTRRGCCPQVVEYLASPATRQHQAPSVQAPLDAVVAVRLPVRLDFRQGFVEGIMAEHELWRHASSS
jgi:hypothetical protein